jgi:hypothetical protein
MKISAVLIASAAAQKLHHPKKQLEKLRKSINFVWDEWFAATCQDHVGRRDRLLKLTVRIENQFDRCGTFDENIKNGGPPARRRRDDSSSDDESSSKSQNLKDLCIDLADGTDGCAEEMGEKGKRVSKVDKDLASKQIGKIIKKFGERYLSQCTKKLTPAKLAAKGKKWENHLKNQKCAK